MSAGEGDSRWDWWLSVDWEAGYSSSLSEEAVDTKSFKISCCQKETPLPFFHHRDHRWLYLDMMRYETTSITADGRTNNGYIWQSFCLRKKCGLKVVHQAVMCHTFSWRRAVTFWSHVVTMALLGNQLNWTGCWFQLQIEWEWYKSSCLTIKKEAYFPKTNNLFWNFHEHFVAFRDAI